MKPSPATLLSLSGVEVQPSPQLRKPTSYIKSGIHVAPVGIRSVSQFGENLVEGVSIGWIENKRFRSRFPDAQTAVLYIVVFTEILISKPLPTGGRAVV